jgi:D-aspartate ligase
MSIGPSLDTTYPALIFKASRGIIHHGAVGVARTLGRVGVPVYAIVEDAYTPLARSRYLTRAFVWKQWPSDIEEFLNEMLAIGRMIGRPAILIPIDDLSAIIVAENAAALRRWFLIPHLPRSLPRQLANKASFYALCAELGIPCARTVVPNSADEIREFIEHSTFPIVAKAAEQWLLLNNTYSAKLIPTREALLEFYDSSESEEPSRMILQEYIPGQHWIYHGYSNSETNLYVSFTGRKLLSYPPGAGSTALGMSLPNETLQRHSEALLKAVSYSGITDMDWRQDKRDGLYKILDCNPRVGMNFRLFENSAGIDVVRAEHLNLTSRRVECSPMVERRLLIVESYYLLSSIRGGGRSAPTAEADNFPLPRSRELAWWSADDALPVLVMSVRFFLQTVARMLRHLWGSARWAKSGVADE